MEAKGNRKRGAAACIAAAVALAIACVALVNCSAEPGLRSSEAQTSENTVETRSSGSAEASSDAPESENVAKPDPIESLDSQSEQFASPPGKMTSQDAVSGVSGSDPQTSSHSGQAPPAAPPAVSESDSRKQPVWVVDSPEWDESVPIHGYTEASICNICGADITSNTAARGKQHMLAGEGSGHHSEVRDAMVGYDTVHHSAEGHWERAEPGGHWE